MGPVTNVVLFDKESAGVASVRYSNAVAAEECVKVCSPNCISISFYAGCAFTYHRLFAPLPRYGTLRCVSLHLGFLSGLDIWRHNIGPFPAASCYYPASDNWTCVLSSLVHVF